MGNFDFFDFILYLGYGLCFVSVVLALVLPLISALGNPKSLVTSAIGIGVLGGIFLISYGISGDEVTEVYSKFSVGPELSKVIGGILTTSYILLTVSILGILFTATSKIFK